MHIQHIEEYKISDELKAKIKNLLQASFTFYPERIYYKQVPDFRLLAWDDSQKNLLAQIAVEHRIISVGKEPFSIFGITDLCVAEAHMSKGIAAKILDKIETSGRNYAVDFILLFADDHRLYERKGYELTPNLCRWLMINDHQTLGIARRSLSDCLMVKKLGAKSWSQGEVDLMGTVF